MSRRISQSITPTTEVVAALRGPFVAKGANVLDSITGLPSRAIGRVISKPSA